MLLFIYLMHHFTGTIFAQMPNIIYGIEASKIEHHYLRLLFDQTMLFDEQKELGVILSAVQLHLKIEKQLKQLQKSNGKNLMNKQFNEIVQQIEAKNGQIDIGDICYLGKFWLQIAALKTTKKQKEMRKDAIEDEMKKNYDCVQIKKEHGQTTNSENLIKFIRHLNALLSDCHFNYLDKLLNEQEIRKNSNFKQLFEFGKTADESELTHQFKELAATNEFDQIKRAKMIMSECLMEQHSVDQLELNNPILLAIGIRNDHFLKMLYDGMIFNEINDNEMFIQLSILCSKIIAYFADNNDQNEKYKNQYKKFWKKFDLLLENINKWIDEKAKGIMLQEFGDLLSTMKHEFGVPKTAIRLRVLMNDFVRCLSELYAQNEAFRNKFNEQCEKRNRLKNLFEFDACDELLKNKFLELFKENELCRTEVTNEKDGFKVEKNIKKMKIQEALPKTNCITDHDALVVMILYMKLLSSESSAADENTMKGPTDLLQNLEINVTLWYYRKFYKVLLELADLLTEPKSALFMDTFERYKNIGQILLGHSKENKRMEEMCLAYKLTNELAADQTLRQLNSEWKSEIEKFVNREQNLLDFNIADKHLIQLPENGETKWTKMNCQNEKIIEMFLAEMRKSPRIDQLHFFAIKNLIDQSERFRDFFYRGGNGLNNVQIKANLLKVVNSELIFMFESNFPEIFHFEDLHITQYFVLLASLLKFQSGTFHAEVFEARIMTPFLLKIVQQYETRIETDSNSERSLKIAAEILYEKIVYIKANFFEGLKSYKMEYQRKSACHLITMLKFVEEFYKSTKHVKINKILQWKPIECETQLGIKMALMEQKKRMRTVHFEILENFLCSNDVLKAEINIIGGAKERIRKLLTDGIDEEEKAKAEQIMAIFRTPEYVHEAFFKAPLAKFYEEALTEKNEVRRHIVWMKADVVVFARWIELALGESDQKLQYLRDFWAMNKYSFMHLYDRIMDSDISEMKLLAMEFVDLMREYVEKVLANYADMDLNPSQLKEISKKLLGNNDQTRSANSSRPISVYWIKNLHYKELVQLMAENGQTKRKFQKLYEEETSTETVEILLNFFGLEKANELLSICESGFEIKLERIDEGIDDETLADKSAGKSDEGKASKKKNKNKRKKMNKKDEKEEKRNQSEKEKMKIKKSENEIANNNNKTGEKLNGINFGGKMSTEKQQNALSAEASNESLLENEIKHCDKTSTNSAKLDDISCDKTSIKVETLHQTNEIVSTNFKELDNEALIEQKTENKKEGIGSNDKISNTESFVGKKSKIKTICDKMAPKKKKEILQKDENKNIKHLTTSEENNDEEENLEMEEKAFEDEIDIKKLFGIKIGNFCEDNFLNLKYGELYWTVSDQNWNDESEKQITSKTLCWTVNFGVYANEIAHRIGLLENEIFEKLKLNKNLLKMQKQWKRLREVELDKEFIEKSQLKTLLVELHLLLKQIVALMDGFCAERSENLWDEIRKTKNQLHSRNLAMAVAGSEIERQILLEERQMDKMLLAIIEMENESDELSKYRAEFAGQLKAARQFKEQRQLDSILFKEFTKESNLEELVEAKEIKHFRLAKMDQISEGWQEIKYAENEKINEQKTNLILKEIQLANNWAAGEISGKHLRDKLKELIQKWSTQVRIQFSSLLHLKVQLKQTEAICICPRGFDQTKIFGQFLCDQLDRKENCADESLNCTLCKNVNVKSLQKLNKTTIKLSLPRMTFKLINVLIDLQFVIMPNIDQLPLGNYNWQQFENFTNEISNKIDYLLTNDQFDMGMCKHDLKDREKLREKLEEKLKTEKLGERTSTSETIKKMDESIKFIINKRKKALNDRKYVHELNAMLKTMSNYSFYSKIVKNLMDNYQQYFEVTKLDKFRQILAYLEMWAKNNQIFNDTLGYLNTKMLIVMLTKVFILYPNSSVPFLVHKFFLTFATWNWPLPVQLAQINYERATAFLSWSPFREWLIKRQTTDKHLRGTIRRQLKMAIIMPTFPEQNAGTNLSAATAKVILSELKIAYDQTKADQQMMNLILPLKGTKFIEKYNHFILIACFGPQINVNNFTNFVMQRILYELYDFIQKSLILANRVDFFHLFPTEFKIKECFDEFNRPILKKYLLIGVKFVSSNRIKNKSKKELRDILSCINVKIKNDYNYFLYYNVNLSSECVEREELLHSFF